MKTGNFIKIRVLLVRTSHNLSYVLFMKLKIEQKFDRNRINLLNIDIWQIQYMD